MHVASERDCSVQRMKSSFDIPKRASSGCLASAVAIISFSCPGSGFRTSSCLALHCVNVLNSSPRSHCEIGASFAMVTPSRAQRFARAKVSSLENHKRNLPTRVGEHVQSNKFCVVGSIRYHPTRASAAAWRSFMPSFLDHRGPKAKGRALGRANWATCRLTKALSLTRQLCHGNLTGGAAPRLRRPHHGNLIGSATPLIGTPGRRAAAEAAGA
jgi:hypothetical protein